MSTFEMKLPDVGEGVAEAEIVEWLVAVGDEVTTDSRLAEVLTVTAWSCFPGSDRVGRAMERVMSA